MELDLINLKHMKKLLLFISIVWLSISLNKAKAQTPITVCPQSGSFSSMTRGYYFTAQTSFTICGVYVEDDMSTAAQSVAIVRFTAGPPPAYAAVTNSFTTLFQSLNYVPNTVIAVPNITVNVGDVIGVYGSRGNGVNSYGAAQCVININSIPHTTYRSGMQFNLATQTGMHDIWSENNGSIGRVTMYTNCCPPPPAFTSINGATSVCQGDTVTYSVPAQTGAVSYNWTVPTGASILAGQGTDSVDVVWSGSTSGQICATWTDTCTASQPFCVNVTVNPTPTMSLSNIVVCNNDTVPASNFVSNPAGATYTWTNSNTAIGLSASGNGNTPAFVATNNTSSPITSTVSVTPTANGCVGQPYTYTITVNPTPVANSLNNIVVCAGDTVPTVVFSGTPSNLTYNWFNSNTASGLASSGSGNITSFIATNNTNNSIISTITVVPFDGVCSGDTVTFTITVNPKVLNVGPGGQICLGDAFSLTAQNAGIGTITWYDDPNGLNVIGTGSPFIPSFQDTGTYVFYVNEVGGCASELDSVVVVVRGVNASINATPTSGLLPLNVVFDNNSTTGVSYHWDFGTGDTSIVFEPTYIYNNEGSYIVTLIVTDGFCYDTTQITIEVIKESTLIIPNVFTPNGDGSNDVFKFIEKNIKSISVEIFNRWGNKVYSWEGIDGGWNGKTSSGSEASVGTYFYIIRATGEDDQEYLKKGSFSLLR